MNDPRSDWREVGTDAATLDPQVLHSRASQFDRRIRWRNLREYGAAILVILIFGWWAIRASGPIEATGAALCAAAAAFVAWRIHRLGSARPSLGRSPSELLAHFRGELERQANLLATVRSWYIAPLLPGMALLLVARVVERGNQPFAESLGSTAIAAVVVLVVLFVVDLLNRRAAENLRRQRDQLG